MRTHLPPDRRALIVWLALAVALLSTRAFAQEPPKQGGQVAPGFTKPGPLVTLKVQVVMARYQGEKRVSSLPFSLLVDANDGMVGPDGRYGPHNVAQLRTGAQVPLVSTIQAPVDSSDKSKGPTSPIQSFQYRDMGTKIDCYAYSVDSSRFRVHISLEDSSVYPERQTVAGLPRVNDAPSFRSLQSSNTVLLKDGQSTEFTAAADKITGEETRVTVTLTVLK